MKKLHILGLAVVLLLTGCQPGAVEESDDKDTSNDVVIEVPADNTGTDTDGEDKVVIDDVLVSEVHEWTEADETQLQTYIASSKALSMAEAKVFLDKSMEDASSMMADRYVADYEQSLIKALPSMSEDFFNGMIQEDLAVDFNYGYFTREQLQGIDSTETIKMIDPLYDIGYKIETSEGMYYPIIDYGVLYQYEDKVTSTVQKYLRLMKRQSDIMAYNDAAVIVPWSELGERLLMAEELLSLEMPSSMKERVEQEFKWGMQSFVFGTNNTPVFNYDDKMITDPEILESFKKLADNGGVIVKAIMDGYLEVLEEEDYKGTDKVYETLNELMEEHINY